MTTRSPFPYEPPSEGGSGPGSGGRSGGPAGGPAGGPGERPRRSRARTLLPLAVAAWAVLEIWLLTVVAGAAGGFTVLLILVAGFVLGAAAIKRAGRRAWQNLAETVQRAQDQARAGAAPDLDPVDGGKGGNGTAMLGGLLLMIPGLVSDAVALLCLFPPTASLLRRAAQRTAERSAVRHHGPGSLGEAYQQARSAEEQIRIHRPDGKVVPGEVVRDDEPPSQG
ncbi:FxsA family membrane protein [Streptomyces boncukensis]|uniref:FxsA family protein n=1 Tax=Streptomyces boncukensis TaxID=2711219 RepID=A0A6G4X6Y3_9ACTN|nr:FxsA family membrane protein [Streptomyces boncukensis]NGO73296.1 FxsA family protein [Streptomyces boncukensis]